MKTATAWVSGWKNDEFKCSCQTIFGKNLLGKSPATLVYQHITICKNAIQLCLNLRNFLFCASKKEMEAELNISLERGDNLRATYIREIKNETFPTKN